MIFVSLRVQDFKKTNSKMPSKLFSKNIDLGVIGDSQDFWLCKAREVVYEDTDLFSVQWYEKCKGMPNQYMLSRSSQKISLKSVIDKVKLAKSKGCPRTFSLLPSHEAAFRKAVKMFHGKSSKPQASKQKRKQEGHANPEQSRSKGRKRTKGKEGKIDSNDASPPKIWRNKVGKRATNRKSEGGPVKVPINKNDPNRRLKPNDRYAHENIFFGGFPFRFYFSKFCDYFRIEVFTHFEV